MFIEDKTLVAPSEPSDELTLNRVPSATYRVQLTSDLGFEAVLDLVDYLEELGISDLYLSPLFRSRDESSHGYDVVSHLEIEPTFGDRRSFNALTDEVRARGMGVLLDVVPNHMGINDPGNEWWLDVLANGPTSRHCDHFDIDWNRPATSMSHKLLLPFLGDPFGAVLERGDLTLTYVGGQIQVAYGPKRFPLSPATWVDVLELTLAKMADFADTHSARVELESIIFQLHNLPGPERTDFDATRDRYREQDVAQLRLRQLTERHPSVAGAMERAIHELNGVPGQPRSFDRLEALLDKQWFRLADWHVAADEINYRRFFDINDLAAIRVELPDVFDEVHGLVRDLIREQRVTGLRIDHPDGLYDPRGYFAQLQAMYRACMAEATGESVHTQLYVVAEKILTGAEELPRTWAVSGTTGYASLNSINRLFMDDAGIPALVAGFEEFVERQDRPYQVIYESKKQVLHDSMASELVMLASELHRIAARSRRYRDFTFASLLRALREVIAWFPVYRTYVRPEGWDVDAEDHGRIATAVRLAKRSNPGLSRSTFDFLSAVLLLEFPADFDKATREAWRNFALKFQQVTGPVTAKGVEDTAFYRYYPLASNNEVGGELKPSGLFPAAFHALMQRRFHDWPHSMTATATHDTKRGEDTRARMNVLSELPDEWAVHIDRLESLARPLLREVDGGEAPSPDERYLLYQTIAGTWPLGGPEETDWPEYVQRIRQYLLKAMREAKVNTSWVNPSVEYEAAMLDFTAELLDPAESPDAVAEFQRFVGSIADAGFLNSLSQTVLKICVPGVPDFYRGTELWDFHLVDPDNRRQVDFRKRRRLLHELRTDFERDPARLARQLSSDWPDARIKLFTIWRLLRVRRERQELFARGDYIPLEVHGPLAEHVVAFARVYNSHSFLAVVPRLTQRLPKGARQGSRGLLDWRDTTVVLPADSPDVLTDVFTNDSLRVSRNGSGAAILPVKTLLRSFPVAALVNE